MAHPYRKELADNAGKRLSRMTAGYDHGEKGAPRADKFARGGGVKKGAKTIVNVNIPPNAAPPPQPVPIPMPPPGAGAGLPPMPPKPPMAGPMAGPMPGGPPPPMMPHSMGGRAFKRGGAVKDGPAWKEGLRNGTKVQHAGDVKDVTTMPVITTRKSGGRISSEGMRTPGLTRHGSESGLGRLDKVRLQKKTYP